MSFQGAPIKSKIAEKDLIATREYIRWFQLVQNSVSNISTEVIYLAFSDSPYTIVGKNVSLIVNTDGGNVTIEYPAGEQNSYVRVANVGSSGNDVILNANGTETIRGLNSQTLFDEDVLETFFDTTEFWV